MSCGTNISPYYLVGFYGDLHLGNFRSDVPSFLSMTEKAIDKYRPKKFVMVLVGDMIEGTNKYRTQIYKMFNIEPLRVQLEYFKWVAKQVFKIGREYQVKVNIAAVLGNHDMGYDYGSVIKLLGVRKVTFAYEVLLLTIGKKRIVVKHQLNRMSRGSYLTWWSGYLLNLARQVIDEHKADMLVTAHTHRPDVGILYKDGKTYIGLPSFIVSNEDRKENKIVLYTEDWLKIETHPKTPWNKLEEFNVETMKRLLGAREPVEKFKVI